MKKVLFAAVVLLLAVASCSKKSAPTVSAPDGAEVFAKNCARCHGPQGVKDERTPNLPEIHDSKEEIIHTITFGKRKMPAFEDKLSAAEIAAVSDLIISWRKK